MLMCSYPARYDGNDINRITFGAANFVHNASPTSSELDLCVCGVMMIHVVLSSSRVGRYVIGLLCVLIVSSTNQKEANGETAGRKDSVRKTSDECTAVIASLFYYSTIDHHSTIHWPSPQPQNAFKTTYKTDNKKSIKLDCRKPLACHHKSTKETGRASFVSIRIHILLYTQ